MIRSYRQRGHLIAKLDPLELMKPDYLDELHPEYDNHKDYLKEVRSDKYWESGKCVEFNNTVFKTDLNEEFFIRIKLHLKIRFYTRVDAARA